jgi:hypothetical protein
MWLSLENCSLSGLRPFASSLACRESSQQPISLRTSNIVNFTMTSL